MNNGLNLQNVFDSPGWSMSSSGSNFVTRWLHLSSSEICLGNQATRDRCYDFLKVFAKKKLAKEWSSDL
jgi:hypothetical protein